MRRTRLPFGVPIRPAGAFGPKPQVESVSGSGTLQFNGFYAFGNANHNLGPPQKPPVPAVIAPITGEALARDPNLYRWQDILLDPCNRTAQNRNTAAIRDALEAIVDNLPEEQPPAEGGGDSLIFFQVDADTIGQPSTAVTEMVYNSGSGEWEPTGSAYTAYDWTPSKAIRPNFVGGFFGIGRIATGVAADALEVLAIEGLARFIEVTLNENMGATTSHEAECTVGQYWGDAANGRDPGTTVIIHDVTNMAPQRQKDQNALAIWDEKRGFYVMIAPWAGLQAPGQAAIIKVMGGDAELGCDDNVKPGTFCVHTGVVQNISLAGNFCTEKFTDGGLIWILDARSCHANNRLNHLERYVGVSIGVTYDPDPGGPSTDERNLYAVVDYAPSIRWFKVLSSASTLAFTEPETNELKCRTHECGGDQPDDAPSAWAQWVDIDPCTRLQMTLDNTPRLVYFPMYRSRCKPTVEQTEAEKCRQSDINPACRFDKWVPAYWNPIAERWDVLSDVGGCESADEVAFIIVCEGGADLDCCVFDAIKVDVYPRNDSYCDPIKERTPVWVRCSNGQLALTDGYCELGVKICNSYTCKDDTRPMYMFQCGGCEVCECPELNFPIRWKLKVSNPNGPCGFMDGIGGEAVCLDRNPFVTSPPPEPGWFDVFDIEGLEPRLLYLVFPNDDVTYPDGAWLEIGCGPLNGTILGDKAWCENAQGDLVECDMPVPNDYAVGISDCRPLELPIPGGGFAQQYRTRTYKYGIWLTCDDQANGITGLTVYLLSEGTQFIARDPLCDDTGPRDVPANTSYVLTDGEGVPILAAKCCDNSETIPMEKDMGCSSTVPEVPITGLNAAPNTCLECSNQGAGPHMFGGCPCNWIIESASSCTVGIANCGASPFPGEDEGCCDHEENKVVFEFEWASVVVP